MTHSHSKPCLNRKACSCGGTHYQAGYFCGTCDNCKANKGDTVTGPYKKFTFEIQVPAIDDDSDLAEWLRQIAAKPEPADVVIEANGQQRLLEARVLLAVGPTEIEGEGVSPMPWEAGLSYDQQDPGFYIGDSKGGIVFSTDDVPLSRVNAVALVDLINGNAKESQAAEDNKPLSKDALSILAQAVLCEDAQDFVRDLIKQAEMKWLTEDGLTLTIAGEAAL